MHWTIAKKYNDMGYFYHSRIRSDYIIYKNTNNWLEYNMQGGILTVNQYLKLA